MKGAVLGSSVIVTTELGKFFVVSLNAYRQHWHGLCVVNVFYITRQVGVSTSGRTDRNVIYRLVCFGVAMVRFRECVSGE